MNDTHYRTGNSQDWSPEAHARANMSRGITEGKMFKGGVNPPLPDSPVRPKRPGPTPKPRREYPSMFAAIDELIFRVDEKVDTVSLAKGMKELCEKRGKDWRATLKAVVAFDANEAIDKIRKQIVELLSRLGWANGLDLSRVSFRICYDHIDDEGLLWGNPLIQPVEAYPLVERS